MRRHYEESTEVIPQLNFLLEGTPVTVAEPKDSKQELMIPLSRLKKESKVEAIKLLSA
jgi:hypothetical protein